MPQDNFLSSSLFSNLIALANFLLVILTTFRVDERLFKGHRTTISRRSILVCLFAIFGIIFSAHGLLKIASLEEALLKARSKTVITSYGRKNNLVFAEINTEPLKSYKNQYNAMLIFRVVDNSVNHKTDRTIAKSYLMDIPSRQVVEIDPGEKFLSRVDSPPKAIDVYLVVLPKAVSPDQISCLSDVETHQGRIVDRKGSIAITLTEKTK